MRRNTLTLTLSRPTGEGTVSNALEFNQAMVCNQRVNQFSLSHRMGEGRGEGAFAFQILDLRLRAARGAVHVAPSLDVGCSLSQHGDEPSPLLQTISGKFFSGSTSRCLMASATTRGSISPCWARACNVAITMDSASTS